MVALERPIVRSRAERLRPAPMSRWWQRHPEAGLLVGWASIHGALSAAPLLLYAGGVNPQACRDAVLKACEAAGVKLRVAVVLGDDILPRADELRASGIREMDTGAELPAKIVSSSTGAVTSNAAAASGPQLNCSKDSIL